MRRAARLTASPLLGAITSIFRFSLIRTFGSLLGFAATFLATAALGPEDAGILFGSFAWASGLAILARWGLNDRLLLEIPPLVGSWREAAGPAIVNLDIATSMKRTAIILAGVALAWFTAVQMQLNIALSFWFIALFLPANVLLQILAAAAKGFDRLGRGLTFEFAVPPVIVLLTAGMIKADLLSGGFTMLAAAYFAGALVGAAGCYWTALRPVWHGRILRKFHRKARDRDRSFSMIEGIYFLNAWLIILVLPFLLPPAEVGIFNLVLRLAAAIGLVSSTIYVIMVPRLAIALKQRDLARWKSAILNCRIASVFLAILFMACVYFAGPFILAWAGQDFERAQGPLFFMAACTSMGFALGPSGSILSAAGMEIRVRNTIMLVAFISATCITPAVKLFGFDGAAAVSGLSALAINFSLLWAEISVSRSLKWRPG